MIPASFMVECQYFNSAQLFRLYTGFIRPCLEYCFHIWGSSPYTSLLNRVESKTVRLIGDPSLTSTLDSLSLCRKVASLSLFYCYYLVTALMNWLSVFHLQWLGHVPHGRHHLPTVIVWNSPMQELIGSVMVSSLLCPAFGTLSLLLYFRLPLTYLPSKGRSVTTLGTRWYDFFFFFFSITLFNPQAPDGIYKPPHVYCRMGFLNTLPFPTLHLSRNAAIVSESLKISDQRMAKRY